MYCIIKPSAKRMLLSVVFLVSVYCMLVPGQCSADEAKTEAFLDASMLVDGWESSYCHIDSFKVRCARIILEEKGQNPLTHKYDQSIYQERIQDDRKFLIRTGTSPEAFEGIGHYQINSFDGGFAREYLSDVSGRSAGRGTIYQGLAGRAGETMSILGYFLESDPDEENFSREGPLWKELKEQYPLEIPIFFRWYNGALKMGGVKVRPYLESVAGESCHVLELDFGSHSRTYWFAHEKGMLPMKKKLVLGNGKVTTKEVKEIASVTTDTGILWYPRVVMEEHIKGPNYSYAMKMTVDEFVPHFKAPPETFTYVFPNGTRVYDSSKDLSYRVGPGEIEKEMTSNELEILESVPSPNEKKPESRKTYIESEGNEGRLNDVAQEQLVMASGNDKNQNKTSYAVLCLIGIIAAASLVFIMRRGMLYRNKTIMESNQS